MPPLANRRVAAFGHDESSRDLEADSRLRHTRREQAFFDEGSGDRDRAVPAHRAVALVVHEQQADVGVVPVWAEENRPVHIRMAARLEHGCSPDVICVLENPAAALEHGQVRHFREAGSDHAQRFAGAMKVEHLDGQPGGAAGQGRAIGGLDCRGGCGCRGELGGEGWFVGCFG